MMAQMSLSMLVAALISLIFVITLSILMYSINTQGANLILSNLNATISNIENFG
ncbi:MAG: hypothetical protein ACP5TL_01635 [Candidatus Micrarchaeia archaeon]